VTKLERFMSKTEPKKSTSKLATAWDDILVLKEKGYTLEQVQAYLQNELKIETSLSNLSDFLKRQSCKKSDTQIKNKENDKQIKSRSSSSQEVVQDTEKEEEKAMIAAFAKKMGLNF